MERIWEDPRHTKRDHRTRLRLEPDGVGVIVGSDFAIKCVRWGSSLNLCLFLPRRTLVLREQVLRMKDFDPRRNLKVDGDPKEINPWVFRLGSDDGVNNRVYVGDRHSLARVPAPPGGIDIIFASADNPEVVACPPGIDLRARLQELRSRRS